MKILVFDDSAVHRKAAKLSLKGHDLTVVGTYDEAQKALLPKTDYECRVKLFKAKYGNTDPYDCSTCGKEEKVIRMKFYKECEERATTYPDFDAVLTDLLVPASRQAQGPHGEQFVGKEMPLGTTIALLALMAGVKKVAVVTDMNHHNHPASAALDCFGWGRPGKIPGVSIICTNSVGMLNIDETTGEVVEREFLESDKGKKKYPYPEGETWGDQKGIVRGKDWGRILRSLLSENKE